MEEEKYERLILGLRLDGRNVVNHCKNCYELTWFGNLFKRFIFKEVPCRRALATAMNIKNAAGELLNDFYE